MEETSSEEDSVASSRDDLIRKIYLEADEIDYSIDKYKEILTRRQAERGFVEQLTKDILLQRVFESVIDGSPPPMDEEYFQSALMTINRAFDNRFDMACELVREAKKTTDIKDLSSPFDGIEKELGFLVTMTSQFKDEAGSFGIFYSKAQEELLEFVKWRASLQDEEGSGCEGSRGEFTSGFKSLRI